MGKYTLVGVFFFLFQANTAIAIELDELKNCGTNAKCLIVDTLEVELKGFSSLRREHESTKASWLRVKEAWYNLTSKGACSDVADVVVGGTGSENGYFGTNNNSVPADFAEHLMTNQGQKSIRCALVVNYDKDAGIGTMGYESSVELGRRALSVVLFGLDRMRAYKNKKGPIRVWGLSKGAAVVASVWYVEAYKNKKQKVADGTVDKFLDPCPSNSCLYMGLGYPLERETQNSYVESYKTANIWSRGSKGYLMQPDYRINGAKRLVQYTNLSDPVYECDSSSFFSNSSCLTAAQANCHKYTRMLRDYGYSKMIKPWGGTYFTNFPWFNTGAYSEYIGDYCGD